MWTPKCELAIAWAVYISRCSGASLCNRTRVWTHLEKSCPGVGLRVWSPDLVLGSPHGWNTWFSDHLPEFCLVPTALFQRIDPNLIAGVVSPSPPRQPQLILPFSTIESKKKLKFPCKFGCPETLPSSDVHRLGGEIAEAADFVNNSFSFSPSLLQVTPLTVMEKLFGNIQFITFILLPLRVWERFKSIRVAREPVIKALVLSEHRRGDFSPLYLKPVVNTCSWGGRTPNSIFWNVEKNC